MKNDIRLQYWVDQGLLKYCLNILDILTFVVLQGNSTGSVSVERSIASTFNSQMKNYEMEKRKPGFI